MGRDHRTGDGVLPRRLRVFQARGRRKRPRLREAADGPSGTDHMTESFMIAKTATGQDIEFRPRMANRHGLITGATGTGKTVTLQALADHMSALGVPVFLADVKGDLTGLAVAGSATARTQARFKATGIPAPASQG